MDYFNYFSWFYIENRHVAARNRKDIIDLTPLEYLEEDYNKFLKHDVLKCRNDTFSQEGLDKKNAQEER